MPNTKTQKAQKLEDRVNTGIIDLTKTGPLTYRQLQSLNNGLPEESAINQVIPDRLGSTVFSPSVASQINYTNNPYEEFGESSYDSPLASMFEYENYQDLRGERQPWYMQLINGTTKGVLTAGTTFVNGTLGLVYGLGTAAAEGRISGIWDNDVTVGLQEFNEAAERVLPNYYTDEEKNSPWYSNIFTSNFLGDKFIKNLGFTIGAFYSGGVYSKALQALKWLPGMVRAGTAATIAAVGEGSIEAVNNSKEWFNYQKQVLDDTRDADLAEYKTSIAAKLQDIEKEYQENAGLKLVYNSETGTSYDPAYRDYKSKLEALKEEYNQGKEKINSDYDLALAKLSEDRAKMGNMDLLLNIPILTASNIFQFGKLWANGFKTANRTAKVVKTAEGTYAAGKNAIEPWVKGTGRALSEGFEEINQKAASETSGIYYGTDVMNYYKKAKDPDAEEQTLSWINSFAEGIAKTYGEGSSWEEFFIGTLTGALGMPAFGKANTGQAYLGKNKSVGMVGGMFDAFTEYNERVKRDTEIANALNERVKSPEFLNYYQGMIRHYKLQTEMDKAVDSGDEYEFKNAEHSQLVNDIAMWDNAGRIDDLIQMINEAADTSPENIRKIIEDTTKQLKTNPKYQQSIDVLSSEIEGIDKKLGVLSKTIEEVMNSEEATSEDPKLVQRALDSRNELMGQVEELTKEKTIKQAELEEQIKKRDSFLGPFVDEKGNPYEEEYIKDKIEKSKEDILNTVKLYRDTKREIDSDTNFSLNSEQLATLTWLKAHKENWDNRASSMAGEIKTKAIPAILNEIQAELDAINESLNKIPESLREENREKAKELSDDAQALINIRSSLTNMQSLDDEHLARSLALFPTFGNLIKLAITKPQVAQQIGGDNVWDLMKKVDDTIKASTASMEYNQKLMEYLSNPQSLQEDMLKADEEAAQKFIEKQAEKVRKDIVDNVETMAQMREALQGLGENHDAVVQQLTEDEDEKVSKLAQEYQKLNSLQNIGYKVLDTVPANEVDAVGTDAAKATFDRIMGKANSIEEALKELEEQKSLALNNGEDSLYESVVAERLQDILDSYNEAVKAKNTKEKDSRKSSKKPASKKGNNKKSNKKKPSLLDDEDESGTSVSKDDFGEGDENEDEDNKTLQDVFNAYEEETGTSLDEETKQSIRDKVANDGFSLRDALGDPELQAIYDTLQTPAKKTKGKKSAIIDFDSLGQMNLDEAIEFLESLDAKTLGEMSAADKKKAKNLLKKMYEKKKAPSVHNDSDEDNSNANDNASNTDNDPRFRSWGAYAKYMFDSLQDRATRKAVYNSAPEAQEQLAALEELGAFEFVEKGELGKLFKAEPDIRIKYIKAKDKRLSDTILLAVEMSSNRQKKAKAVKLINGSDGKQYQVVGALGFNKKDDVANINYHEIDKELSKERGKDRPDFFVSDKFYNKIKHIYSGRMVKSGQIAGKEDISGGVEDRSLKQMLHGVKPILGVYYNASDFRVPSLPNGSDIVPLNTNNGNPREGSVWLMVQEADGRYYAKSVKVRRFNLDEYDLDEHKDSPILEQIIEDLETICDPEASTIDRYTAKYDLQEHLLYFPEGIDILYSDDTVSISGIDWGNNIGKGLSPKEKARKLLESLQSDDLNLRFQIDTADLSDSDYVQDLLDSDVMTSDLLQARNINASFDLYLNDSETGEPIEEAGLEDNTPVGHTGNRGVNSGLSGNTVNIGKTEYTILSDGSVLKKNREVTDDKIISQANLIDHINRGLIQPIKGTNVYIGTYSDGTEFGVKKTKTSHTIVEGQKLEAIKEKAAKSSKTQSRRKSLEKARQEIEDAQNEGVSDETLLSNVQRGVVLKGEQEVKNAEEQSDEDLLKNVVRGVIQSKTEERETPQPKRKGPPIVGLQFNPESSPAVNTTKGNLERLSRKRAVRERVLSITDNGKRVFNSIDDFIKYVKDPKNEVSKIKINNDDDMKSLLDAVECNFV